MNTTELANYREECRAKLREVDKLLTLQKDNERLLDAHRTLLETIDKVSKLLEEQETARLKPGDTCYVDAIDDVGFPLPALVEEVRDDLIKVKFKGMDIHAWVSNDEATTQAPQYQVESKTSAYALIQDEPRYQKVFVESVESIFATITAERGSLHIKTSELIPFSRGVEEALKKSAMFPLTIGHLPDSNGPDVTRTGAARRRSTLAVEAKKDPMDERLNKSMAKWREHQTHKQPWGTVAIRAVHPPAVLRQPPPPPK